MLSGIGDRNHLEEVGVPVVHDLPEVGKNLQDHLFVTLNMDVTDGFALDPLPPASAISDYKAGGGVLSTPGVPVLAHVRTGINVDPRPDLQLHMCSFTLSVDMGLVFKHILGIE